MPRQQWVLSAGLGVETATFRKKKRARKADAFHIFVSSAKADSDSSDCLRRRAKARLYPFFPDNRNLPDAG
jgi:hypothetical protein